MARRGLRVGFSAGLLELVRGNVELEHEMRKVASWPLVSFNPFFLCINNNNNDTWMIMIMIITFAAKYLELRFER